LDFAAERWAVAIPPRHPGEGPQLPRPDDGRQLRHSGESRDPAPRSWSSVF